MDRNGKYWKIAAVIFAVIAAGAAGFYAGGIRAESAYQEERELNIMLNTSELDGLGEIDGPIYVTGHKTPDADTVGCSIGYAELLKKMGYDAQAVVLGEINNQTRYILERAGVETPMLLDDAAGCNMILVDHSEYAQSADGLQEANVITIIDHHGDGTVTTANPLIYDARPLGSAATIVWIRYRNYGIEPDQKTAMVMMGSILSDTSGFLAGSTTEADRKAVETLSRIAGVTDVDAFYTEMYKASISYGDMTDEEIFLSDYKNYEAGNRVFGIGCVSVYDRETAEDMAKRMKKVIASAVRSEGAELGFAQVSIFHDDISVNYLVPSNEAAAEIIETAYGDRVVFDGTSYVLEPGVSRKTDLVPAFTAVLEAYPRE